MLHSPMITSAMRQTSIISRMVPSAMMALTYASQTHLGDFQYLMFLALDIDFLHKL